MHIIMQDREIQQIDMEERKRKIKQQLLSFMTGTLMSDVDTEKMDDDFLRESVASIRTINGPGSSFSREQDDSLTKSDQQNSSLEKKLGSMGIKLPEGSLKRQQNFIILLTDGKFHGVYWQVPNYGLKKLFGKPGSPNEIFQNMIKERFKFIENAFVLMSRLDSRVPDAVSIV